MPSRYSKKAPPAVETKLKSPTTFNLFKKETVSPPPTTEKILLDLLFSIILFAIFILPFAKSGFSKYPAGPFQSIVLLLSITVSYTHLTLPTKA